MALFNANLIIRETRKARGLTQEKLAEGICARETIVKLEKGTRKPNWYVYREILRRLGIDAENAYHDNAVAGNEMELYKWLNGCYGMLSKQQYDEVKAEIEKKDADPDPLWKSGLWYTMLLRLKTHFYSHSLNEPIQFNPYDNPQLAIQNALEYLSLFRPDFSIDKMSEYFLATHEYELLNWLAKAYMGAGEEETSITIWRHLKANAEKHYTISLSGLPHAMNKQYRLMLATFGPNLWRMKRYEEALQIAEEGLASFTYNGDPITIYFELQELKSSALRALGWVEESRDIAKRLMLIIAAFDGTWGVDFARAKKQYEDMNHGEKLDLTVSW